MPARLYPALALAVLGLTLPAAAAAKPKFKLYTIAVTGSAHQASHDSGTEDYSSDQCTEFHTTTYTTSFSAGLAKPRKLVAAPWGEDAKIRLVKPKVSWLDVFDGTSTPKFANAQCSFQKSQESGTCKPNALAKDPRGVPFAPETGKGGRIKLIQNTGNSGLFSNTGGASDASCHAESRISSSLSGGFLDHPGIQTTLKVSKVKALKVGHHVTAKGTAHSSVTAKTFSGVGHFKNTVTASYTITVKRTK